MYPESFKIRHYYLFLSVPHAVDKWVNKNYDLAEIEKGWHRPRHSLTSENIDLPLQKELRNYTSDDELDPSDPLREHLFLRWPVQQEKER